MVRTVFNPVSVSLDDVLFSSQNGGHYFIGSPRQRGAGVGDALRSLWRFMLPIVKFIGKEGVATSGSILTDISQGVSPKEAVKSHAIIGTRRLLDKASDRLGQVGKGCKRRNKPVVGQLVKIKPKKINRADIFAPY